MALASFVLFCLAASVCQAQTHNVLCDAGDGSFESAPQGGVKVWVGPARNGELATRACEANLSWNKQKLVVATGVPRIDLDALGVDLGLGVPVVALEVQKSSAECCMSYQIYSLQKPPRLLRTISGGGSFSAADTDLDGRVEIWADDSASVDGFDNLDLQRLDFPPAIVLRFTKGQLLDVSSEFLPYFDQVIAEVRAELDAQGLSDFKNSDGKLVIDPSPLADIGKNYYLQGIKSKVLEIVWSYLYSGREQEAWRSLADLWPAADVDRVHAAILKARARGIRSQVDGVSNGVSSARKGKVTIFDGIRSQNGPPQIIAAPSTRGQPRGLGGLSSLDANKPELVLPQAIELWCPASAGASEPVLLDVVVDAGGKVRSVESFENLRFVNPELMRATQEWKFIPAFKDGRAVAARVRVSAIPKR